MLLIRQGVDLITQSIAFVDSRQRDGSTEATPAQRDIVAEVGRGVGTELHD